MIEYDLIWFNVIWSWFNLIEVQNTYPQRFCWTSHFWKPQKSPLNSRSHVDGSGSATPRHPRTTPLDLGRPHGVADAPPMTLGLATLAKLCHPFPRSPWCPGSSWSSWMPLRLFAPADPEGSFREDPDRHLGLCQVSQVHPGSQRSSFWLVVWTPLKNISQLGLVFPIYGKIKNGNQTTNQSSFVRADGSNFWNRPDRWDVAGNDLPAGTGHREGSQVALQKSRSRCRGGRSWTGSAAPAARPAHLECQQNANKNTPPTYRNGELRNKLRFGSTKQKNDIKI